MPENTFSLVAIFISLGIFFGIGALLLGTTSDVVTNSPIVDGSTIVTSSDGSVAGASDMLEVLRLIDTQRVDFVGIGDSNQIHGGDGWDHGFAKYLSDNYPIFATAFISQQENGGSGSGHGYLVAKTVTKLGDRVGAPTELALFSDQSPDIGLFDYGYYNDTVSVAASSSPNGMRVESNAPIGVNNALRFDLWYGTFETGQGNFTSGIRKGVSGFNLLANGPNVETVTGSYGIDKTSVSLSAAERNHALEVGYRTITEGIEGPFFSSVIRGVNPNQSTGAAYTTMEYFGGQPTRVLANNIINASDEFYTFYFGAIRDEQLTTNNNVDVVFTINSGLNDRADSTMSVGPSPAVSSTKEGYKDNIQAIINKIKSVWISNGWSTNELHFMIIPSHPISDPDDTDLQLYRIGATEIVNLNDNTFFVNIASLTDFDTLTANGWYDGAGPSHLAESGYEGVANLIFGTELLENLSWAGVAQQVDEKSQTSFSLLILVMILIGAVVVLTVVRKLSQ